MRLQKYLAMAGVGSRRACERYIQDGRVHVNGRLVTQMGQEVEDEDEVFFDGKPVQRPKKKIYMMLNKPVGVLTSMSDPQGRATINELVEDQKERFFPVGRLDYETEGMLLLTNDGELAYRLTHPKFHVEKQYRVEIGGSLSQSEINQIRRGMVLKDGYRAKPALVSGVEGRKGYTSLRIAVTEGHNRLVRQIFESLGKRVLTLKRERIGTLKLGGLPLGRWRYLTEGEVNYLRSITKMPVEK